MAKLECTCHLKLDKCKSPIYVTKGGFYRKPSEWMKCGKLKRELEKLKDIDKSKIDIDE